MGYDGKLVINTLPPGLFFLGGSGVGAFVGLLVGSCCGFHLNLHAEFGHTQTHIQPNTDVQKKI